MLREPWVAAIFSLMLPGLGHVYAGRLTRGLTLLCAVVAGQLLIGAYLLQSSTRLGLPFVIVWLGFVIGVFLYVPIDAYQSTKVWNLQHKASTRPRWQRGLHVVAAALLLLLVNPELRIARYSVEYMRQNIAQLFVVPGDSMAPAILPHDRIVVDKRIYRSGAPRRGDIVAFRYPFGPGRTFVKRVVGLPGERVELRNETIRVNGRSLRQAYTTVHGGDGGCLGDYGPTVVPADSFFVLGDNWCNSEDSRYFGSISRRDVIGKVTKIYYPFNRSGPVR